MKLAYPDLKDSAYVYRALVGFGMFHEKLPPCFSSENLLNLDLSSIEEKDSDSSKAHSYISVFAQRNTNVPRILAIPHPESYVYLCNFIKKNWNEINCFIGSKIVNEKISFIHFKKLEKSKSIFKMNSSGYIEKDFSKYQKENLMSKYILEAKYIVTADISNFFPSIYTHSIEWAINGKSYVKERIYSKKSKKESNETINNSKDWAEELDTRTRFLKENETNGLLIGPHTSNLISEIILSEVDHRLYKMNYTRLIRNIDDYEYYADSLKDAENFLTQLVSELKDFELSLNHKKTNIVKVFSNEERSWINVLKFFKLSDKELTFSVIDYFLECSIIEQKKYENLAVLNYAIKVISEKKLNDRAKKLYVQKIMSLSIIYPYLVPYIEEFVFEKFLYKGFNIDIDIYINRLFKESFSKFLPDISAFCFYFAIKYDIDIFDIKDKICFIIDRDDTIELIMLYRYLDSKSLDFSQLRDRALNIFNSSMREIDRKWIFIYEVLSLKELKLRRKDQKEDNKMKFLRFLKENNITFLEKIERFQLENSKYEMQHEDKNSIYTKYINKKINDFENDKSEINFSNLINEDRV